VRTELLSEWNEVQSCVATSGVLAAPLFETFTATLSAGNPVAAALMPSIFIATSPVSTGSAIGVSR
jgi:hypothetical protein